MLILHQEMNNYKQNVIYHVKTNFKNSKKKELKKILFCAPVEDFFSRGNSPKNPVSGNNSKGHPMVVSKTTFSAKINFISLRLRTLQAPIMPMYASNP